MRGANIIAVKKKRYVFLQGDRDDYSFFLLTGDLELSHDDQIMKRLTGGDGDARNPLSQLQPRQLSAKATSPVQILRTDRKLIERLLTLDHSPPEPDIAVTEYEIPEDEETDWMSVMLQSELFSRIPPANIQRIFAHLEPMKASAGTTVIQQGEIGEHYFVIQRGRCEVTRRAEDGSEITLATLGTGDSFGEEALITDAHRNASVTMLTDGELMRLTKQDFIDLIQRPAIGHLTYAQAQELAADGGRWLDVRQPEEHAAYSLPNSLNIPIGTLRTEVEALDREVAYLVYCDSGSRSSAATFVLTQTGLNAAVLEGGLGNSPVAMELQTTGKTPVEPEPMTPVSKAAPTRAEDAAVRAFQLQTELAKADLKMREAIQSKAQADAALPASPPPAEKRKLDERAAKAREALKKAQALKLEAIEAKKAAERQKQAQREQLELLKREAAKKLRAEQARLGAEASAKIHEATERERRKTEEAQAKAEREIESQRTRIEAEAAEKIRVEQQKLEQEATQRLEAALQEKVVAEKARQVAEEETQKKLLQEKRSRDEQAAKAAAALAEAKLLREEIASQRAAAEQEAKRKREEEQARIEALRLEADAKLKMEQARLEQQYQAQAQEIEQLQRMRKKADAKLKAERQRVEDELTEARERIEEAKRLKKRMEAEKRDMEKAAQIKHRKQELEEQQLREQVQQRIEEERRRLEGEFARTTEALAKAEREKNAADAARAAAAEETKKVIADQQAEYRRMREEEQKRLQAERARLAQQARVMESKLEAAEKAKQEAMAAQAKSTADVRKLRKEAALARNEAERSRLAREADKLQTAADEGLIAATRTHAEAQVAEMDSNRGLARYDAVQRKLAAQLETELYAFMNDPGVASGFSPDDTLGEEDQVYLQNLRLRQQAKRAEQESVVDDLLGDIASQLNSDQ